MLQIFQNVKIKEIEQTFTATSQETVIDSPISGGDTVVALSDPLVATK